MSRCYSLDGTWKLAFCPEDGRQPETPEALESAGLDTIDAAVPGNVELDLVAAGRAPDPYEGCNVYQFRPYEFYTWWYTRTFSLPAEDTGRAFCLRLEGVDTFADLWLNGERIGQTDNGLTVHDIAVPAGLLRTENTLQVHIRSAVNQARAMDYPAALRVSESIGEEMLYVRKAPHCFGWDIAPRLLSAGLWRSVQLIEQPAARLTQVYYGVREADEAHALLEVRYRFVTDDLFLEDFTVRVEGRCGDAAFSAESRALFVAGKLTISIDRPRLWWPRGYGAPDLYDVTLSLCQRGQVLDQHTCRVGLRVIEVQRAYGTDAGEFAFVVNGVPIQVRGTNWVPLDCLHSRDAARLERAHALLREVGCNFVRCWGGNVYESDRFFDLCDEHGILVWQDFAMACAVYDQDADFARVITREAENVVCRLRNHPSLALWAGDNEVDQFYTNTGYLLPHARFNRLTREVLPRVLAMHDPYRAYLESSPYLPEGTTDEYIVPEQHNWGPRDYFKRDFYKHSTAHFISEIGYHGCPPLSSLARYIPADEMNDFAGGRAMRTHCTEYLDADPRGYNRNQLMLDQVRTLFGEVPSDPEALVLASQISQAEAKKYFVESTRLKKWRRTGVIWWNLLDGWPQISDAVVDYYFEKKLAFWYLQRVQQPVCLMVGELENWKHAVVLANDTRQAHTVAWRVLDEAGAPLAAGCSTIAPGENQTVAQLPGLPGGQRQRVALGRAMVRDPAVFLLDEPLSNLDAKLRTQMRTEITKLHKKLDTTFVYVTHDQTEAMTMGDRIVVMKDGIIQQADTPQKLYDAPCNLFVAGFIGSPQMNFLDATIVRQGNGYGVSFGPYCLPVHEGKGGAAVFDSYVGRPVVLGIRPENLHAEPVMLSATPDSAVVSVEVELAELMGAEIYVHGQCAGTPVVARVPSRMTVRAGDTMQLTVDLNRIHLFDPETTRVIGG